MITITLNNGTKIEGLKLSGNVIYSETPLTLSQFRGKLNPVTITGSAEDEDTCGVIGVHNAMEVCYIKKTPEGKYALALADIDPGTLELAKNGADIAYLAMMTGITL